MTATECEASAKQRIGQDQFREKLIRYWGTCAVTGCKEQDLLIASHIKPWEKTTNKERIDPYNGLLLSPALDKCFDQGYVSFDDKGQIMILKKLTADDRKALGINSSMRLRRIDSKHEEYLKFHREYVFQEGSLARRRLRESADR